VYISIDISRAKLVLNQLKFYWKIEIKTRNNSNIITLFTEWIIPYIKYLRLNGCQTATPYITHYSLEMIEQVFCDAFIDDFQKIPELFNTGFSCFFSRGYPSVTLLQFGKPCLRFFFLFALCLKKHRTLIFLMSSL